MEPEFHTGDLVLLDPKAPLEPGAAIVARHPFKNIEVIKYIRSIEDDLVFLESPAGDDSNQFGRVPVHTVRGTVTYNWKAGATR